MPISASTFPVRAMDVPLLEQATQPVPGVLRQEDNPVFVNDTGMFIEPGEPIPFFDCIGITTKMVAPDEVASIVLRDKVSFRLNPNEALHIYQGQEIYWDYDLEESDVVQSDGTTRTVIGWATAVQPTNGYLLGRAMVPLEPTQQNRTYNPTGSRVAADAPDGSLRATVDVWIDPSVGLTKYGSTPYDDSSLEGDDFSSSAA